MRSSERHELMLTFLHFSSVFEMHFNIFKLKVMCTLCFVLNQIASTVCPALPLRSADGHGVVTELFFQLTAAASAM